MTALDNTSPPDQSVQPLSSAEARRRFERAFYFVTQKGPPMHDPRTTRACSHRMLSVLIGLLGLVWAVAGVWHAATLPSWQRVMMQFNISDGWITIMACIGLIQTFGAWRRNLRHIGFVLGFFSWLSVFFLYIVGSIYQPAMALPLLFGGFCGLAYLDEVVSKIKFTMGNDDAFFA